MKTGRLQYIAFAAALCLFAGCNPKVEPPQPEPVFPEVMERNFQSGSSAEFFFNANLDWELSIPVEYTRWFYFDDNGFKSSVLRGGQGLCSAIIHAVEVEGNFDVRRACVEMTMGGRKQTVYRMNLMPSQRTIALFEALKDEKGSYTIFDGSDYVYSDTPSTELHLTWPVELVSYMLPMKVVSNFSWGLAIDYPKWMRPSVTNSSSDSEAMVIKGNANHYPEEAERGVIRFVDVNSAETVFEIPIEIDGCKDIARVKCDDSVINFNIAGQYKQNGSWVSTGCNVDFLSMKGSDIIALEITDGKMYYRKDGWVKISAAGGSQASKAIVDEVSYTINAERNTSVDREALLLAIPAWIVRTVDLENGLLVSDRTALKPEYQKYMFAKVHQAGLDPTRPWGVLSPVNTVYTMALQGGGLEPALETDPDFKTLSEKYSTEEIYVLSYNNWFSYEKVLISTQSSFDTARYLDMTAGEESDESLYLELSYPEEGVNDIFRVDVSMFDEEVHQAVVLRSGDDVVAVIKCVMSESYWPETGYRDIYFSIIDSMSEIDEELMPKGVTLQEITSGEVYDKYAEYGIPVWRIAYDSPESKYNAMINVPPYPADNENSIFIDESVRGWLSAEGGFTEQEKAYLHISMKAEHPESGKSSVVVLYGGGRPLFALECVRNF